MHEFIVLDFPIISIPALYTKLPKYPSADRRDREARGSEGEVSSSRKKVLHASERGRAKLGHVGGGGGDEGSESEASLSLSL